MTKQTKHHFAAILGVVTAISISGMFPVISIAGAATTETIWFDGFESNDFSQWDSPVGPQWVVNTGSVTGFHAGAMIADPAGTDSALSKSQSTAGFEHIKLTYWYKAIDFATSTDFLRLEYTTDGATWIPLSTINKGLDDHVIREVVATLPASADDNEDFALRFVGKINGSGAEVWIDDVSISGEAAGGDLGTRGSPNSGGTTASSGTTTPSSNASTTPSTTGSTTLAITDTTGTTIASTTSPVLGTTTPSSTSTTTSSIGTTTPPVMNRTSTPHTPSPEGSYETCNDGIDNDLDGATDVADIKCLLFRPTVTVTTQVIGGTATASDFHFKVLFGTTSSATTTESTTGVDITWPYRGTWQVIPLPMTGYNTAFGRECGPSGFFEMLFNTHKNCLLINTFGTATTTATTTPSATGGNTSTSTATSTNTSTGTTTSTSTLTSTGTTTSNTHTNTTNTNGTFGSVTPQCSDGIDNDGDGLIDMNDPGCSDPLDNSEADSFVGVTTPVSTSGGTTTIATTTATTTDKIMDMGEVLGTSTPMTTPTGSAVCTPLLTKYLRPWGHNNESSEVKKLQGFLNDHEGEDIVETGFFGHATRAAVERFQLKYADDILVPWLEFGHSSIHVATGIVYKMTLWKINALHCEDNMETPAPEPPEIP